jgi:hypothetical protein
MSSSGKSPSKGKSPKSSPKKSPGKKAQKKKSPEVEDEGPLDMRDIVRKVLTYPPVRCKCGKFINYRDFYTWMDEKIPKDAKEDINAKMLVYRNKIEEKNVSISELLSPDNENLPLTSAITRMKRQLETLTEDEIDYKTALFKNGLIFNYIMNSKGYTRTCCKLCFTMPMVLPEGLAYMPKTISVPEKENEFKLIPSSYSILSGNPDKEEYIKDGSVIDVFEGGYYIPHEI